ncbi:hypothetical protein VIBRN418_16331 [Vibrio sp. N418]|uniref:hypothetical protein n=1 Tax=Vibrio sp. (strain N418) TaxID=701176 RepID=UPI00021BDF9B|nr:hypothetical protein [Vibrio sp. N418]EGU30871.1 hypothetical protein VIBRN418_16331 [Vibrio sp. N418]
MDEFSLEALSEKIYNYKTRDYFNEIVSSYNNDNYRSATVMLWSVAVIDLVFKLTDLVDLHEDKTAESLLKEMSEIQSADRKSSKWEHKLVTEVAKRTKLLSSDNISFLEYLYQQRNLSAHPVLDSNLELHRPNKETVRALIVNCVDGILSKPPFFSKDIVGTIALDLEASKSYLEGDEDKLKHYLESRFLSQMTEKVELEVFKSLWKFVFKLENDKAVSNRNINFQALIYIYKKNENKALKMIDNEKDYFSDISKEPKTVFYLIRMLSKFVKIYKSLKKSAKIIIDDRVDNKEREFYYSNFKYKSLTEFHEYLLKYIVDDDGSINKRILSHLYSLSDSPEWWSKVRILRNAYYGVSGSFDTADQRFGRYISPFLGKYKETEMLDLLSRANNNDQIYGRGFNKHVNKRVKEAADKLLGKDFDFSKYPKFLSATQ